MLDPMGPSESSKRFGNTSLPMPTLGFGAATLGNLYRAMTDAEADSTLDAALNAGINYFDTAPHYGFGLSESRLGSQLAAKREQLIISSKVGRLLVPTTSSDSIRHGFVDTPALEPVFDYSYDAVMRSFESSLQRLKTNYIDILFAHDLGSLTHGEQHAQHFREFFEGGYRAMNELRAAGVVKAIGLGTNEWEVCEQALAHGDFDGFLLAGRYSLLEQSPCDSFFPLCKKRGVSIISGGPFNSGILASGVSGAGPFYYNYEPAPLHIIERVKQLEIICAEFSVPLPAAALQFPGAHPQVCSVIAGLASPAQVEQAIIWMNYSIPQEFWQRLRERNLLHPDAPTPF
ncbi:oxidoreductase [Cellvibrio zantedeschiae]|uniref:Oxidoreductase n=1 Tax=Cellvibrio zantedeschiae TaxID=1237077 RepID=A0ABQ3B3F4_9GAMM|nr:aldo/keto reductase [Cellvibrio zantedeschiae]GGY73491.1 oxidoreductase [Cellvibrio zantedeschiae]